MPSLRARVRMDPGLEPASGSVSPKQPRISPSAILGRYFCFCSSAAEGVDGIHAQPRLHADERTHAAVAALQFLCHQAVFHSRHAGATVAFEAGAIEAQLAHRADQFLGEAAVAVALFDNGDQVFFNELARVIAHQPLVVIEQRVELDKIYALEFECHDVSLC